MEKNFNDCEIHPVNNVIWVETEKVKGNDYNPNTVAPPEMKLLETSISNDGFTQPIVVWEVEKNEHYEVVDGFHRHMVGQKIGMAKLPVVVINKDRSSRNNRIASTIRHNRARGKHKVQAMSDIVLELKNRNWKNTRIARELGMDEDEILRLCQITGLEDLFKDDDFSKSWEIEDSEPEYVPLTDEPVTEEKEKHNFRTVNTSDEKRIFHTWEKWECYKAGFYATHKEGMTQEECEQAYATFLSNLPRFEEALKEVTTKWKNSCEHYLTNQSMNRIAWLGQASACYVLGIPSKYCGGFNLLSQDQQLAANQLALVYLNKWLLANGMDKVTLEEGLTSRQSTIY